MNWRFRSLIWLRHIVVGAGCCFGGTGSAAGPDAADVGIIRVMTYNVQFLPEPVSWKNKRPDPEYRARRIGEALRRFDLVGLQEVFHEQFRHQIIDQVHNGWNGLAHTVISPRPEGFHTSGGCLLLTSRPLLASTSMVFAHYSKPEDYGLRADGFAAKGVIHARISRSESERENFVDVFVTHLEARADDLRPAQYEEMAAYIRKTGDLRHPMLLLGDLNTYGMSEYRKDPASQYSQLFRKLNAARADSGVIDLWPELRGAARGGTTEQESSDIGKRIDYIILGNPRPPGVQLVPQQIDVELHQDVKVGALSDHNAVTAVLRWPAIANDGKSLE